MKIVPKREWPKQVWGKSMTIPDQSYTVKQLFERFRKGLPVDTMNREAIYSQHEDDEIDLEKLSGLSKMDKADLAAELNAHHEAEIAADKERQAQRVRDAEAKKQAEAAQKKEAETRSETAKA